jgi:hypothetical protein
VNIDFDSLRDPDAPRPGARERAAVDARARRLRARSRMNRLALSSVWVVAVVALVFGIVASQRDNGPHVIVVGPSGTSTTLPATSSTTTPIVTQSAPAVSASFISPTHGWALERDGTVSETTDGGASWSRVGSLHTNLVGTRMRFADAEHGFVFDQRRLFTTSDGGATWAHGAFPVSQAFDFDVSRGTVYTVGFDDATSGFHVWSSPTDHLSWTEDPLSIQPGAGPVASFQFVFSGDAGWLLYVDRVVISGARLTSTGRWGPWGTPPCTSAGGAAYLAASSPTDLVASCQEGTFTGPRITNGVYFSNDGGQTFTRHDAPNSGLVASPDATTAVVPGSAGVERTTDRGATWHGVFDTGLEAGDLGFTTPTQGFIVFSNGDLLMTHDAGATWQKVTLP